MIQKYITLLRDEISIEISISYASHAEEKFKKVGTCNCYCITTKRIGFAFQTVDCNYFYLLIISNY